MFSLCHSRANLLSTESWKSVVSWESLIEMSEYSEPCGVPTEETSAAEDCFDKRVLLCEICSYNLWWVTTYSMEKNSCHYLDHETLAGNIAPKPSVLPKYKCALKINIFMCKDCPVLWTLKSIRGNEHHISELKIRNSNAEWSSTYSRSQRHYMQQKEKQTELKSLRDLWCS